MSPAVHQIVLSAQGITKVYPGTRALDGVDFDVRGGAVTVLVGENGAGKSTLMKILAGVEQPTAGRILLGGEPIELKGTDEAARHRIGIVFQELNLFPNMSIAENVFVGKEKTRLGFDIDRAAQRAETVALMQRLEHPMDPDAIVGELRIGQQQIVEIAKVLAQEARIIIMDEPTSALSAPEVEILFRVISELRAQGVAIIYISHRLEELVRIGDYITVLRDGRVTGSRAMAEIDVKWIIRAMTGADSKDYSKKVADDYGPEVLRTDEVTLPRPGGYAVDRVSLSLRAGEIVGIYGLMGAGRSEFFDCVMGRHAGASGRVVVDGIEVGSATVAGRIRHGLALIPEDRKAEGLVHTMSVRENMTLASLWKLVRGIDIDEKQEKRTVRDFMRDLSIKAPGIEHEIGSLSGGNQQKVVIGKALMTGPKVLLMDEPSRGIDIGAKAEVFRTMRKLAADGLGILFVTSDLEEVIALSDRILVMSNGRITGEFDRGEATEDTIVAAAAAGRRIPTLSGETH